MKNCSPCSLRRGAQRSRLRHRKLKLSGRNLGALCCVIALIALYCTNLVSLIVYAAATELDSYILLIPFISAYLLFLRRKQLADAHESSPLWAIAFFAGGVVILAAAWRLGTSGPALSRNDLLTLTMSSFVCFVAATGFAFLGRQWMASAAVPIAFLIFLIPLPDTAVGWLETTYKLASADVANLFFLLSGTPVSRDGTVFQLPGILFEVAEECSGLHSSLALFITSLLASHLFLKRPWHRVVLLALVIPLGILRNGFRILVIGLLCVHVGPQMIHSVIHTHGGPLFFALSLVPFVLLLGYLRRQEVRTQRSGINAQFGQPLDSKL